MEKKREIKKIYNWKARGMSASPAAGKAVRTSWSASSPPAIVYEDWMVTSVEENGDVYGYMEGVAVHEFSVADME